MSFARHSISTLTRDLGYALRSYRRTPGFVVVALLSLTLGIGAVSAIFSVVYGVVIDPYPYADADEMWWPQVRAADGRGGRAYTLDELRLLRELPAFSDVMGTSLEPVLLTGEFAPESFTGILLTGNAFNFIGVPPVVGRTIQPTDIRPDGVAEPVAVLSHRLWLRLFDGDPGAVGRTLRLNGRPHTIVGVMPPRFGWYGNEAVWLPLSLARSDIASVNPLARLAPGMSRPAAEAQLRALHARLAEQKPATFPAQGHTTVLLNYMDLTVASGELRTSLRLLFGAVGFLLLIACANVANLQLARGSTRAREIAVRASLGAGRRQLLQQLLTESVLLSAAGGVCGVLFAFGAVQAITALMPPFFVPNEARVAINMPVLLFSLAVSLLTGIVFGTAPAMQTSRTDPTSALRGGRGSGAEAHGSRTRHLLVVVEVALSVVLLVSATLTARSFLAVQDADPGVNADGVISLSVPIVSGRRTTLEQRNALADDLLERVRTLPGVQAVTFGLPFNGPLSAYSVAGLQTDPSRRLIVNLAGADHLRTFGIALRAGRMFDATEVRNGDRVAVINETAARQWPDGTSPVGARLRLALLDRPQGGALVDRSRPATVIVIGVIADTRNAGLRAPATAAIAIPYSILAPTQRMLTVRTAGEPALLFNPIRAAVAAIDPEQPLGRPVLLSEMLAREVVQPRFTMALFNAFALLGLGLAAAGIYSVLSFHVARRTQELGVRMALGAPRHHVLTLMLTSGARLVLTGLVIGVAVSMASMRLLSSQLAGVRAADPLAYLAVGAVMTAVGLAACYIPARRAAGVDPMIALRQD